MILLRKAKSLFQRIRRRSISVSEHKADHKLPVQGANGGTSSQTAILAHVGDGASITTPANAINLAHSQSPISEYDRPLDFEGELSAEDHFIAKKRLRARGTFQKVDVVRWDHDEEEWSLEDFEFELPANSIDTGFSTPPTEGQKQQEISEFQGGSFQHLEAFVRLREFALRRRWLSAVAALDKASRQSAPLSKRERAAIEHVLKVAGTITRHRSDSDLLRRALLNAENPKDEVELGHSSARPQKASAAKVVNLSPPDGTDNTENGMPTQKEISSSVLRVRQVAAGRSWLSPKSSRALAKLSDKKATLGRSETNALNYLLGRFDKMSELMIDVENLRKRIGGKGEQRG